VTLISRVEPVNENVKVMTELVVFFHVIVAGLFPRTCAVVINAHV
jgi:hypothetical protein